MGWETWMDDHGWKNGGEMNKNGWKTKKKQLKIDEND